MAYSTQLVAQYLRRRLGQPVKTQDIIDQYGMSRRTIVAAIRQLEDQGWKFDNKRGPNGYIRLVGMRLTVPEDTRDEA